MHISNYTALVTHLETTIRDRLADWPSEWQRFHWPGYTYEHTLRVRNLSMAMARKMGGDVQIVELAALLHDIGKPDGEPHNEPGAERAEVILAAQGVPVEVRERVCNLVYTHLAPDPAYPVENLALSDADFIDANFGCVALTRYITIRGGHEVSVPETIETATGWIDRVDERRLKLITDLGREIAEARYRRMQGALEVLRRDLAAGDGSALSMARYLNADAHRPSLFRQLEQMEKALDGKSVEGIYPSEFLREFVSSLHAEIAGDI